MEEYRGAVCRFPFNYNLWGCVIETVNCHSTEWQVCVSLIRYMLCATAACSRGDHKDVPSHHPLILSNSQCITISAPPSRHDPPIYPFLSFRLRLFLLLLIVIISVVYSIGLGSRVDYKTISTELCIIGAHHTLPLCGWIKIQHSLSVSFPSSVLSSLESTISLLQQFLYCFCFRHVLFCGLTSIHFISTQPLLLLISTEI